MKNKTLAIGYLGALPIAAITSMNNCQGREYLTGRAAEKTSCHALNEELKVHESRKEECSYTLRVETQEGDYTIGVLGNKDLAAGDEVKFLKQSTRWVTSFNENRKGFLSGESIEKLVEIH